MRCLDSDTVATTLAAALNAEPMVQLAYLFGSYARRHARAESDIDLGILVTAAAADEPRATVAGLLASLGRVVPSDRLDLVLLNGAPSLLRHRIIATGRLLVARDLTTLHRFVTRAIQDYQDMQVRRAFFYRKRLERIREGRPNGGSGDLLAQARRAARLLGRSQGVSADD